MSFVLIHALETELCDSSEDDAFPRQGSRFFGGEIKSANPVRQGGLAFIGGIFLFSFLSGPTRVARGHGIRVTPVRARRCELLLSPPSKKLGPSFSLKILNRVHRFLVHTKINAVSVPDDRGPRLKHVCFVRSILLSCRKIVYTAFPASHTHVYVAPMARLPQLKRQ